MKLHQALGQLQPHGQSILSSLPSHLPSRPLRRILVRGSPSKQQPTGSVSTARPFRITLPTSEVQQDVALELVRLERSQAIIVADVQPGSSTEQAGVHRGQRLSAISDPVRESEVWPIGDRPSMRFVQDALRMRSSGSISVEFQEYLTEDQVASLLSPSRHGQSTPATTSGAVGGRDRGSSNTSASVNGWPAASAAAPSDDEGSAWDMLTTQETDTEESRVETIGERLARRQLEAERSGRQVGDVQQQRMQRRKDYMAEVSKRNDTGFFAAAALASLGPALAILAAAYFSGYLDKLAGQY